MKTITALAAVAALTMSSVATAAPRTNAPVAAPAASKLSIARAASPAKNSNKLIGESPALSVVVFAAVIGGLVLLSGALDSDNADSN